MTYDAVVWLLVGLGVGVAGSLMLLMGYTGLERARLGRRLRQARATAQVAATAVTSMPVRMARLPVAKPQAMRPEGKQEPVKREAATPEPATPEAKPVAPTPEVTEQAKPTAVVMAFATPKPVEPKPASPPVAVPVAPAVADKPSIEALPAPAAVPAAPRKVQSVEALFAEAFANDKLPGPKSDESPSKG